MVAYSFKAQFVQAIVDGTKRQTIRADRKRHVRIGEMIQHYCGMRTKQCFKIIPDQMCIETAPIRIWCGQYTISKIKYWNQTHGRDEAGTAWMEEFARADGFKDLADMEAFFVIDSRLGIFKGEVIKW